MHKALALICLLWMLLVSTAPAHGGPLALKDYPEAERKLADTVDPWGLAFSDQMARFQSHFASGAAATTPANTPATASPDFVAGFTHNLVKVFPNKYWFRGEIVAPGALGAPVAPRAMKPLWAATGSTASFQVAVLPRAGAADGAYTVRVRAEGAGPTTVWREEFVDTGPARY
ncbi:MAG: hypothetical protein NTW19_11630, partial [Planctomycetota bacterium]|nr:hypothetical protein [Planctomycetota bacterium]